MIFSGNEKEKSGSQTSHGSSPVSPATATSNEDSYFTLLQNWATRDGYPVGDRDEMIQYGNQACSMMDADPSLGVIKVAARIKDNHELPGKQAGAIVVAAAETLCPQHNPMNKPSTRPSSTVRNEAGPIVGTRSTLLGVDMPPGSKGVRNVNDFNNDGEPDRFESWEVPLTYDSALTAMKQVLQPYGDSLEGIPWEEGNSEGTASGSDRYVDWWWGRDNKPLILVRIDETTDTDGALIQGVRTDITIERRD